MKKNNKKGFTLVELVIVVAVMAILVAVAIPTVGAITGKAKVSVYNSNAKTIESMLKLAEANADNGTGAAPKYTEALTAAKLGIKDATFYINADNNVYVVDTTATNPKIPASAPAGYTGTVVFAKNGDVTLNAASGSTGGSAGGSTGGSEAGSGEGGGT